MWQLRRGLIHSTHSEEGAPSLEMARTRSSLYEPLTGLMTMVSRTEYYSSFETRRVREGTDLRHLKPPTPCSSSLNPSFTFRLLDGTAGRAVPLMRLSRG